MQRLLPTFIEFVRKLTVLERFSFTRVTRVGMGCMYHIHHQGVNSLEFCLITDLIMTSIDVNRHTMFHFVFCSLTESSLAS